MSNPRAKRMQQIVIAQGGPADIVGFMFGRWASPPLAKPARPLRAADADPELIRILREARRPALRQRAPLVRHPWVPWWAR